MKFSGTGRIVKAVTATLALGLGMTACSRDYTVGYLYATAAGNAQITAYAIDFQSGALTQLSDSPIASSDQTTANPVTVVAAPNGQNIYVVNRQTSNVVQFAVGTDGKLFGQATTNVVTAAGITGSLPIAAAVDPAGTFLYVAFSYQNGFTTARPGPGGVAVFPLDASGKVGAPVIINGLPYIPVGNNPVGIAISPKGGFMYVVDQETSAAGTPTGALLAFSAGANGVYSNPVANTQTGGFSFPAGTTPSAVAVEPRGVYIYITDQATNVVYAYQNTNGTLQSLRNSPYATGNFPLGITVDPRGSFVYVANSGSNSVSVYNIASGGDLTSSGTQQVDTGPSCVTIEPALGIYLFTSNRVGNSVSAEQLDPHNGSLKQVQGTQFTAQSLPSCLVAVANGAHATQIVQ